MDHLQIYTPFEDIYYSLSIFEGTEIKNEVFSHRVLAFADLIENIIFSDEILFEKEDGEIDKKYHGIMDNLGINHHFKGNPNLEFSNGEDLKSDLYTYMAKEIAIPQMKIDIPEELKVLGEISFDWKNKSSEAIINSGVNLLSEKEVQLKDQILFFADLVHDDITDFEEDSFQDYFTLINWIRSNEEFYHSRDGVIWSKQQIVQFLSILLVGYNQSALTLATENDIAWYPTSLKGELMLNTPLFAPSSKVFVSKLNNHKYQELSKLNDFIYNKHTKFLKLPILFSHILSKVDSLSDFIDYVIEIKNSKELKKYRKWCNELDLLLIEGNQADSIKIIKETEKVIKKIASQNDVNKKVNIQISFPPSVSFDVPANKSRQNSLIFLKKLYNETLIPYLNMEKLKKII
ncbi:hypothetical protein [Winogradskyella sp. 3972H.M.0a.05]|uniref:hypothetical protein n=1 Tax=Winogradskyella sp. 3972H.M.0a.05 TaxID=2950277 RepID=UPI0033946838